MSRCRGVHAFDPITFACTRRGCSVRRDEPGQTYMLAPDTAPLVSIQETLFGELAQSKPTNPPREEPGQGGLFS